MDWGAKVDAIAGAGVRASWLSHADPAERHDGTTPSPATHGRDPPGRSGTALTVARGWQSPRSCDTAARRAGHRAQSPGATPFVDWPGRPPQGRSPWPAEPGDPRSTPAAGRPHRKAASTSARFSRRRVATSSESSTVRIGTTRAGFHPRSRAAPHAWLAYQRIVRMIAPVSWISDFVSSQISALSAGRNAITSTNPWIRPSVTSTSTAVSQPSAARRRPGVPTAEREPHRAGTGP